MIYNRSLSLVATTWWLEEGTKKQCCGSRMFIPDLESEFFHTGSRIRIFFHPGSASKNCNLNQKTDSKLSELRSGLFIPDPDPDFLPFPDPGSRSQLSTGSRTRIRHTDLAINLRNSVTYFIYKLKFKNIELPGDLAL